jgi:hypothetical protein
MISEKLTIKENSSGQVAFAGLIISVRPTSSRGSEVIIGYPGMPNVGREMLNGDAILYETMSNGIIEIRAIAMNAISIEVLVTQISPQIGLLAAAMTDDPNNAPFSEVELQRVGESLEALRAAVRKSNYLATEQFELLSRKLDEI